ncbi:MAG: glycoside hydrolase family 127 protein, partial [Clostridia bacterium]|nr:glycoside hydrolase family 127 protein [Clostridia bacterium]
WVNGTDNLFLVHANTTIPKAIGFVRAYMEGEGEDYLKAAEFFWQTVIDKYTYANGGVSGGEVFNRLYLSAIVKDGNPSETCTVYNMIKLSKYLYEITDDVKYIDYIERALLNGIMGSIDEDGCKTYYQNMYPDARKVFNPYDGGFWCCVGTGMENFPLAPSALFYERKNGLDINIFVSSEVRAKNGMRFEIRAEDELTTIKALTSGEFTLRLRIPRWCDGYELTFNGAQTGKAEGEYISVTRNFAEGDTLVYRTEYKTQIEYSDAEDVFTLRYGPYQMVCTDAGVSEIAGNVESGWMANPVIYRENGNYYLQLDGEKRLNLQKYGLITHQQYNTFFVRVDG